MVQNLSGWDAWTAFCQKLLDSPDKSGVLPLPTGSPKYQEAMIMALGTPGISLGPSPTDGTAHKIGVASTLSLEGWLVRRKLIRKAMTSNEFSYVLTNEHYEALREVDEDDTFSFQVRSAKGEVMMQLIELELLDIVDQTSWYNKNGNLVYCLKVRVSRI